jgi:hypothetical protein
LSVISITLEDISCFLLAKTIWIEVYHMILLLLVPLQLLLIGLLMLQLQEGCLTTSAAAGTVAVAGV